MNYKLAKQLKDAGFKGGEHWREPTPYDASDTCYKCEVKERGRKQLEDFCIPTLSELIEACGEDIYELNQTVDGFGKAVGWNCRGRNKITTQGKTPEEAVAKLWLELNK